MKFALIDGKRIEATKEAKGFCPSCKAELVARCGDVRIHHWGHKGKCACDPWWESETEWHRNWKDKFPIDWQEVIHIGDNSEKHIADVKTNNGWVVEFQYSCLKPEERRAREAFYTKLIWVVDGLRRKRDRLQFQKKVEEESSVIEKPLLRVHFPEECRLLEEWRDCDVPVFFDFHETILWLLFPKTSINEIYLLPLPRNVFIESHHSGGFDKIAENIKFLIRDIQAYNKQSNLTNGLHNRIVHPNDLLRQR